MTLEDIVRIHHLPTDKGSHHSYLPLYEEWLAPYRERPIRLLEIGVWKGGSLALWSYYFPYAAIYGIDLRPQVDESLFPRSPCILQGNAYDIVHGFIPTFDIIIDDGSHIPSEQILTLDMYSPLLRPGGLLIIEDIDKDYVNILHAAAQQHTHSMIKVHQGDFPLSDNLIALWK